MDHTRIGKDAWVAFMISVGKALQYAIYLLRFLGQINLHEDLAQRHIQWITKESKFSHEAAHNGWVEFIELLGQGARYLTLWNDGFNFRKIFHWRFPFLAVGKSNTLTTDTKRVVGRAESWCQTMARRSLPGRMRVRPVPQSIQAEKITETTSPAIS